MANNSEAGLGGVSRRGLSAGGFGDLGTMTRGERAAKYARDTKPEFDRQLSAARSEIVVKYRKSPSSFPDGIDSKWDRWYVADDWTDDGVYVGGGPCVKPLNPDPVINTPDEKAAKLAAGRAVLSGVERRLGVNPFVAPPVDPVTETIPSVTETPMRVAETILTRKPGRPKKKDALTAAERMAAARARKKDRGE